MCQVAAILLELLTCLAFILGSVLNSLLIVLFCRRRGFRTLSNRWPFRFLLSIHQHIIKVLFCLSGTNYTNPHIIPMAAGNPTYMRLFSTVGALYLTLIPHRHLSIRPYRSVHLKHHGATSVSDVLFSPWLHCVCCCLSTVLSIISGLIPRFPVNLFDSQVHSEPFWFPGS